LQEYLLVLKETLKGALKNVTIITFWFINTVY